jgi:hypothetical protein
MSTATRKPWSVASSATREPPNALTRSFVPTIPCGDPGRAVCSDIGLGGRDVFGPSLTISILISRA